MKNKIGFRVDTNSEIGMGHFMRCMTVLNECVRQGYKCLIYTSTITNIKKILGSLPLEIREIKEKVYSLNEAVEVRKYAEKDDLRILILDSYYVNQAYINELGKNKIKIAMFQDYDMHLLGLDMIIEPNSFFLENSIQKADSTIYLEGLKYQPVRDEFFRKTNIINDKVTNVAILSGGVLPIEFIEKLISSLSTNLKNRKLSLVVSPVMKCDVLKEFEQYDVKIVKNNSNLSDFFSVQDVVISASGSTIYELIASRTPTVTYSLAENQRVVIEKIQEITGVLYAGAIEEEDIVDNIIKSIRFLDDKNRRLEQVEKMKLVLPDNGAKNIVEALKKL